MRIQKRKEKQTELLSVKEEIDQKHLEDLQRLRGFRLFDDDFLTKCFEDHTECSELVLQIVLDKPDLKVVDVRTQVFAENLPNRSVWLDVLATDSTGRKFNIEVQRSNKGAGRKRARYNSSMMDVKLLKKGEDFDMLPETGEQFRDGSHILYVNGAYRDETPIGRLMHDFFCTNPSDMYYGVLADRVRFFKESREGIIVMCEVMEKMRNESLQEGMKEGMKAAARRMLKAGKYALDEIAEISGFSLAEVEKLNEDKIV